MLPIPKWLISIPAWGQRCVGSLMNYALPALRVALATQKREVRWIIHTDGNHGRILNRLSGAEVHILSVPPGETVHHSLGACEKAAMNMARNGERVALLCADMVPSIEAFDVADKHFDKGKKLIMCAATRTLNGTPPIGIMSRGLLAWTMDNQHPMITECFFGTGKISMPWATYFRRGSNIVLHGFHLHPFAMVKTPSKRTFSGATADWDLAQSFNEEEIHLVRDADEMSFAELSPADRLFPLLPRPFVPLDIAMWAERRTQSIHKWFFKQPIIIQGNQSDLGQMGIIEETLGHLEDIRNAREARELEKRNNQNG